MMPRKNRPSCVSTAPWSSPPRRWTSTWCGVTASVACAQSSGNATMPASCCSISSIPDTPRTSPTCRCGARTTRTAMFLLPPRARPLFSSTAPRRTWPRAFPRWMKYGRRVPGTTSSAATATGNRRNAGRRRLTTWCGSTAAATGVSPSTGPAMTVSPHCCPAASSCSTGSRSWSTPGSSSHRRRSCSCNAPSTPASAAWTRCAMR